jgi:FAD/FMN-containing dehydrogenase
VCDNLLAVWVTLPDGAMAQFGSRVMKDVVGYEMKRRSIGSGKRFDSAQQVTLKVRPEPHGRRSVRSSPIAVTAPVHACR